MSTTPTEDELADAIARVKAHFQSCPDLADVELDVKLKLDYIVACVYSETEEGKVCVVELSISYETSINDGVMRRLMRESAQLVREKIASEGLTPWKTRA